jgi:S-adenosylmethionine hydrolase
MPDSEPSLPISFLSDFGLADEYVGVVHGVLAKLAPASRVIDVGHSTLRGDIRAAALALTRAIQYLPEGVALVVVDPGVGSERKALAVDTPWGYFVGPDNGVLSPAVAMMGGASTIVSVENPEARIPSPGETFHGRDVFAPASAHLALGLDPAELGPPLDLPKLVRLELPQPEIGGSRIQATVLYVDRFGNVALNLAQSHAAAAEIQPGVRVELAVGGESYFAEATRTFADAQRGELILFEDSYGSLAIAITGGDAASTLRVRAGDAVRITRC